MFSIVYCLPPTVYRLLSAVYRLLPAVYRLLSTAYRLPPTAYCTSHFSVFNCVGMTTLSPAVDGHLIVKIVLSDSADQQ